MNNLGSLYHRQAESRARRTAPLQGDGIGTPRARRRASVTVTLSNNLALVYVRDGKFIEAERLHAAVVASAVRVLGEKHPTH